MEMAGDYPDVVIGCAGGGSNFAGLAFPFIGTEARAGKRDRGSIAVEPAACPTLTKGIYAFDFGDTAALTPLVKMHTLGHAFIPPGIHAGGLRYHGMAPLVSHLLELGPDRGAGGPARPRRSRRRCSSLAPRASCPRRSRRTPSAWRSTRRCGEGDRRGKDDPLQPERPRPLRPLRLRQLPERLDAGPGVSRGGGRGCDG